jgi:hypothetical protein
MQYLLLIYGNESVFGKMTEAEQGKISQEYGEYTQSIAKSGHFKGGNELDRTSTATTVRMRDGKRLVTDGPFAETKTARRLLSGRSQKFGRRHRSGGANSLGALGLDRSQADYSASHALALM